MDLRTLQRKSTIALCVVLFSGQAIGAPTIGENLSYKQAIAIGVKRNIALLAKRAEKQRQALLPESAYEDFSPLLNFHVEYTDDAPATSTSSRQRRLNYGLGVEWKSTVGTKLEAGLGIDQRLAGTTTDSTTGTTSNITHSGDFGLSLTQPLLKDAWSTGAATPLQEAAIDSAIQREIFRDQLNSLIVEIDSAYWQLAFAQGDLATKMRSRDRAKGQFDDTAENIRRGIVADAEIYVVEENLVFFKQELIRAKEHLRLAQRKLLRLLNLKGIKTIKASSALDGFTSNIPPQQTALKTGLKQNPEIRLQRLRLKRARVDVAYQKNQQLPSLDLAASLTLNGLQTGYGQLWEDIAAARRPDARVGLVFEIPLWRAPLAAKVQRSQLYAKRRLLEFKDKEQSIHYQIANLLTEVDAEQKRLKLALRRKELNQKKLEAEVEKYKNGISTLADVVRFQRELDQAAIALAREQRNLHQSYAKLLRAQGDLHHRMGIGLGKK